MRARYAQPQATTQDDIRFEKAYASFRANDFDSAKAQLIEFTKANPGDARAIALQLRLEARQTTAASVKKARANPDNVLKCVSELVASLEKLHQQLESLAMKHPGSAVVQEFLGESGNELSGFTLNLYAPLLKRAGRDSTAEERKARSLKRKSIIAFEKSVELGSTHTVPYVRLVAASREIRSRKSRELLLTATEVAPDDGLPIKLLGLSMWQSRMLEDPDQRMRAKIALSKVSGDALAALKKSKRDLTQELFSLQTNIENAEASGVYSAELARSLSRLTETLVIIDDAIESATTR